MDDRGLNEDQPRLPRALHRLARLHGIRTTHIDALGCRRTASAEAVIAVLRSLGVPIESVEDAPQALQFKQARDSQQLIAPVQVAWGGRLQSIELISAAPREGVTCEWVIAFEDSSEILEGRASASSQPGRAAEFVPIAVGRELPFGYHELQVRMGSRIGEALLIVAPEQCYGSDAQAREFGLFAPWYALHSERSQGVGDVGDLATLANWVSEAGCTMLGTLPMLATYLDEPFDPSPYSPVSRCFWNELIINLREVSGAEQWRADSPVGNLRAEPLVDYRAVAQRKRSILEQMMQSGGMRQKLAQLVSARPDVHRYAQFRAVTAAQRKPWPLWPARLRSGELGAGDYDPREYEYHMVAQSLAHDQLAALSDAMRRKGTKLYLDLPLGVHGGGYDTWRYQDCFASNASVGAPPDAFFVRGQNWGFPPPIPQAMRQISSGPHSQLSLRRANGGPHAWFIESLRAHMRIAHVLRLDHVMGLHRLFWIPHGFDGCDGMYVHYPANELYAILCLESHRHRTRVLGENLGTVPRAVNRAMNHRGVLGMYVGLFEFDAGGQTPLKPPPQRSLATLDTHDTATFASFWEGRDVQVRRRLGLLDEADAVKELAERAALRSAVGQALAEIAGRRDHAAVDAATALEGAMMFLAGSPAEIVLAGLEDFWLELEAQNVPGTLDREHPNWRRRLQRSMEQIVADRSLAESIRRLVQRRRESFAQRSPAPSQAGAQ